MTEKPQEPTKLELLDNVATRFDEGYRAAHSALAALPDSRGKAMAATHLDTGALWAQQTLNDTRTAIQAEEAAKLEVPVAPVATDAS
tara:strand:- start:2492 stop:2752 length:261 start_codon:yes stop_codon:yes gene_type:complete